MQENTNRRYKWIAIYNVLIIMNMFLFLIFSKLIDILRSRTLVLPSAILMEPYLLVFELDTTVNLYYREWFECLQCILLYCNISSWNHHRRWIQFFCVLDSKGDTIFPANCFLIPEVIKTRIKKILRLT